MSVLLAIGVVFSEVLVAVFTVMAFLLLAKQVIERRQWKMPMFAVAFLAQAAAVICLLLGHVIAAYGNDATASQVFKISFMFVSAEGFFLLLAARRRLKTSIARVFVVLISLALFCAAVVMAGTHPLPVGQALGVAFPFADIPLLLSILCPIVLSAAIMVTPHLLRIRADLRAGRRPAATDRLFAFAGAAWIVCIAASAVTIYTADVVLISLSFLSFAVSLGLLFFCAYADEHPNPAVRENPAAIVTRSLIFRAVLLHSLILLAGMFILLSFALSYFVQHTVTQNFVDMRRDLQFFSRSYSSFSLSLIDETARLAESRQMSLLLANTDVNAVNDLNAFFQKTGGSSILRVVNAQGQIIYSSFSKDETGRMLVSKTVADALRGTRAAAIEKDDALGIWTVRAAVQTHDANGAAFVVVLDTDVDSAFGFSDYVPVSLTSVSGYGYVAQTGEQVFTYGTPLDKVALADLAVRVRTIASDQYETGDATYVMRPISSTDGSADGFFYTYFTATSLASQIFRVIAAATSLTVFATLLIAALLLMVMSIVLRPLRELREAVVRMGREDYGAPVPGESPDDVGMLASAFSRARDAVGGHMTALKASLQEQQDFLDHATRELRTPLHTIRWTLELMRYGDKGRMSKEQLEMVEQLNQTSERLTKTVQNLEDAILVYRGRIVLRFENLAVEDIIDDVVGSQAAACRAKNVDLRWTRPTPALPRVTVDGAYLRKVVLNLVSNAVQYTPKGGHVGIAAVTATQSMGGKKGSFIKVTIEDNGIGIPSHESHRVFSRFFRAQNVADFETEGTGLGLYLAKRLVELHGGDIRLESSEGVGTKVAFAVPVATKVPSKKNILK